ncbi:hypothetical protein AAFF_G00416580 [Aldrovandia affinis]|uniref:Uncharacterized protein n=1 Tax=Aldrovandia affinis TaxID=143900 RepID=A0AAD7SCR0_9TELE|nr:hypothetical protein AAFF_G00416580 [Aldrovandia affinis]
MGPVFVLGGGGEQRGMNEAEDGGRGVCGPSFAGVTARSFIAPTPSPPPKSRALSLEPPETGSAFLLTSK